MWINDDAVEHSAQITLVSQTACMFNEFANDFHMLKRLNSQVFWHFECHKYSYSEIVLNTVWHHYTKIIITLFPKSRRWLVETSWWFFFSGIYSHTYFHIYSLHMHMTNAKWPATLNKHGKCDLFAWLRPHSAAIQF